MFLPITSSGEKSNPVRITTKYKRWLWFCGIYAASIGVFAAVLGALELVLPK